MLNNNLSASEQIARIMTLIYKGGLTTTSGGNISIREPNGDIWITPAALDKGNLKPEHVVCVRPDGTVSGEYTPSSELPFHRAIYESRSDIRAVIHAHPPALVSYSIVRKKPDTSIIPQVLSVCGRVGYASYRLPGTVELGESIAGEFGNGFNCLVMENHGTVVGGTDSDQAFQRFETLEFCARTLIKASQIGKVNRLSDEQLARYENATDRMDEMQAEHHFPNEEEVREEVCAYVRRACKQKLMISSYGTVSVRLDGESFMITPNGANRYNLKPDDLVLIKQGRKEAGKIPSRSASIHQQVYKKHSHINCIISTQAPNATAFCVSGETIDTHTIPESYFLLNDIKAVPYGSQFGESDVIANTLSKETPVLLIQNDSILTTGGTILQAFDRLEVAEFGAKSLIDAGSIGKMVPISKRDIQQIREKFMS